MGQTCATETGRCRPSGKVMPQRKLAWKRDEPDDRDKVLRYSGVHILNLPPMVDLRPQDHFPIYEQGSIGSCTANALGAAYHFAQVSQGYTDFVPSRLFIYYNERRLEGHVHSDSGSSLRSGVKSLCGYGVCDEGTWPYIESKLTMQPSEQAYREAMEHQVFEYARVPHSIKDMRAVLSAGFPFAFGMILYNSFMMNPLVAATGRVMMPMGCCDSAQGGHAVLAVGYDDDREVFIVRNSWGSSWGDGGYFYLPYEYMESGALVMDLWAIKAVEGGHFPTVGRVIKQCTGCLGSCAGPKNMPKPMNSVPAPPR